MSNESAPTVESVLAEWQKRLPELQQPISEDALTWLSFPQNLQLLEQASAGPGAIARLKMSGCDLQALDDLIHFAVLELARAVYRRVAEESIQDLQRRLNDAT